MNSYNTNAHYVNTLVQYIEDMQMFWLNMVFISSVKWKYYFSIIDFNGMDIRIYLPEKVVFKEAAKPR